MNSQRFGNFINFYCYSFHAIKLSLYSSNNIFAHVLKNVHEFNLITLLIGIIIREQWLTIAVTSHHSPSPVTGVIHSSHICIAFKLSPTHIHTYVYVYEMFVRNKLIYQLAKNASETLNIWTLRHRYTNQWRHKVGITSFVNTSRTVSSFHIVAMENQPFNCQKTIVFESYASLINEWFGLMVMYT